LVPVVVARADAVSPNPLEGCAAAPLGDDGWDYECAEAFARVEDTARQIDAEPYLRGEKAAQAARGASEVDFTRERSRFGGRAAEVLRATYDGVVRVTALVPFAEGTRSLRCESKRSEWCAKALDALAASPWRGAAARGTTVVEAPPLRIGDHRPKVPSGCSAKSAALGGQIVCPGGFIVGWASMTDEDALSRTLREYGDKVVTAAPWPQERRAEIEPKDLPCRIAGVPAMCRLISVSEGPRRFVVIWGGAALRGTSTMAFCTSDGQAAIPSPCSIVFEAR
jgi:hypothetical protein